MTEQERHRSTIWERLNALRYGPHGLLLITSLVVGALVVPDVAPWQYQTDQEQLGRPATENIKAPFDLEIEDVVLTQERRLAARDAAPRVFDFDPISGRNLATRFVEAMALARAEADRLRSVDAAVDDAGVAVGGAAGKMPAVRDAAGEISAVGTGLDTAALERLRRRFEGLVGVELLDVQWEALAWVGFSDEVGSAIADVLRRAQRDFIISDRAGLAPDFRRGISVRRLPDQLGATEVVADLARIIDLAAAKRQVGLTDVQVGRAALESALVPHFEGISRRLVSDNLHLNRAVTEVARQQAFSRAAPVMVTVSKGEMIVRDGERLTRRHLALLKEVGRQRDVGSGWLRVASAVGLVLILISVVWTFGRAGRWRKQLASRELVFLASHLALLILGVRLWFVVARAVLDVHQSIAPGLFTYGLPLAAGAMIVRLVMRVEPSVLFAVLSSLVVGLMADGSATHVIFAFAGAVTGAASIGSISARSDVLRGGLWAGLAQAGCVAFAELLQGGVGTTTTYMALALYVVVAFAGGLLGGFVALAVTPVVEITFGYTTALKLLELSSLNHPALKDLIVKAPGSYHHSIVVSSLAEAAASKIGASPLLARVMAYYHDIGKSQNADYFIENQRQGKNPHDTLKPWLSAEIIAKHVDDGLDIARQHGLGEPIKAAIVEHHGTTVMSYFYHRHNESDGSDNPAIEDDYRYRGRKPQTRESALVMIADSLEAASRTYADRSEDGLRALSNKIINAKFIDGQLDECDLTLRDLELIGRAFQPVLASSADRISTVAGAAKKRDKRR